MSSMKDEIPFEQMAELDLSASRSPQVKSNAVLKYSAVSSPATYATLQSDTNINNPPSNWLKSYSDAYGLNYAFPRNAGFTSFRMANTFLECVGQVDVVSGSENVKNLLKIPYSEETVSMMVHRVENTLLIDDFDIHKHLRSGVANDWSWLRKFYYEYVLSKAPEDKTALSPLDRTRTSLLEQSLESKFLHYSLAESEEDLVKNNAPPAPLPITSGPALPEPLLEEGLPDSKNYKYTRNVVWSFEDIRMLLGTDMPIFGGPTRPCISLRLRDASKPINVLTGIDYWLDNLMSNVPEVVMCYHLDGIVQKYELIKTEDLPYLPESKFSPKLIRDVAQNILSFLKSNATKAGHTYWLFKGKNDDAVKLYDLTSLCSDTLEDKGQNPFTVPVGMLLYRVARNMKANGDVSQLATIRVLLKNCLTLLDKEKHPQIVTSAHFILSDVYVPCDTDPCSPQLLELPDSDKNCNKEEAEDDSDPGLRSVPINDLCISKFSHTNNYSPPPITSGLEERSNLALQHVKEGLDCLQYFEKYEQENAAKSKENEPKMAKPHEPIPMPYSKLVSPEKTMKKKRSVDEGLELEENKEDNSLKALLCRKTNETMPTWQKPDKAGIDSWKVHLGLLLTKKACLVYSILVERELETEKFWSALKHIAGVLRCCEENKDLVGLMLAKAADCLYSIVVSHQSDTEDFYPVVERPEGSLYDEEIELFSNLGNSDESRLIASLKCYQRSLKLHYSFYTMKNLANVCNVLNSYYKKRAVEIVSKGVYNEEINYFIKEAEKYLKIGLQNFDLIGDKVNWALLMSNLGSLNRTKAHSLTFKERSPINLSKQKQFFKKAIENYTEGIKHMESRKLNPHVWDVLHWEMSCTYLDFETLLHDTAPPVGSKDRADFEREMVNILHQALESCDLKNTDSQNYSIYQYRAAILHHKLASLHRSSLLSSTDASKKPQLLRLINNHYSKTYSLLLQLESTSSSIDILKVQVERIALEEIMAENAKKKKKHFLECLNLSLLCKPALQIIENEKNSDKGKQQDPDEAEEEKKMLQKLLEKLQFILKSLVKISSSEKQNVNALKKVYASSLKKSESETEISHLIKLLDMASNFTDL